MRQNLVAWLEERIGDFALVERDHFREARLSGLMVLQAVAASKARGYGFGPEPSSMPLQLMARDLHS